MWSRLRAGRETPTPAEKFHHVERAIDATDDGLAVDVCENVQEYSPTRVGAKHIRQHAAGETASNA